MFEFVFIVFSISCWFGLCAMFIIFISRKRNETLSLRSFLKMARNQNPQKWVVSGLPREYSTETAGFFLRIGKYPKIEKKNDHKIICYSYRMFVSTKQGIGTIFDDSKKIAKTYKQIHQEPERMKEILEKWKRKKSGAKIRTPVSA